MDRRHFMFGPLAFAGAAPATGLSAPPIVFAGSSMTYSSRQAQSYILRRNGGALMTDMLPSGATMLPSGSAINVVNVDAAAYLIVSVDAESAAAIEQPSGNPRLILGPFQSATVLSNGTSKYYAIQAPERIRVGGSGLVLYVNPSGNDTNHGFSASSPLRTIQAAGDFAQQQLDFASRQVNILLADGIYTSGLSMVGPMVGQHFADQFDISGNPANPALTFIDSPTGCFTADDGAQFGFAAVKLRSANANLVLCARGSSLIVPAGKIQYDSTASSHLCATQGGQIVIATDYTITGNANTSLLAQQGSLITTIGPPVAVTHVGTPNINVYAFATDNSVIGVAGGMTFVGGVTGQRHRAANGGGIDTGSGNVDFFPGTLPGSPGPGTLSATGGWFA